VDESTGIRPLLLDLQDIPRHNQGPIDSSLEIPFYPKPNIIGDKSFFGEMTDEEFAEHEPEFTNLEHFLFEVRKLLEQLRIPNMPFIVEERGSKGSKNTLLALLEQVEEVWDEDMFRAQFKDWFDMNENDPLLVFLRSQHTCIRGSVDDFYTWLVKSEYIDSMTALKEAVCDDDYYNDTMKVGSGSSGIKVFKRKVFKRALSEYEEKGKKKAPTTNHNEPPEELVCPISLVLMTNDPVVAADGITYERVSIEEWFKKSKTKGSAIYSPVHGTEMESMVLTPNISVRNMARAFKDEK